jgi:tellurite resistance protein TerC
MEGIANSWMWAGFALFVVVAITVDLVVLDKKGSHTVSVKEALGWSLLWVTLALVFNAGLWFSGWTTASAAKSPTSRPPSFLPAT